jgi:NADPH:quinone reductase-like Zn-dependent oxidoreductase
VDAGTRDVPDGVGVDGAGVVETVGEGVTRFSVGDEVFGQLLIAPIGSGGTYAEDVAVRADAPLARTPSDLDDVLAAALPTAGAPASRWWSRSSRSLARPC